MSSSSSITKAQESASFWRQCYACLSMYTLAATIGSVSGLSGVALPQIEKDLNFSKAESAFFVSISQLGMIPTCVVGGVMGQRFGRRKSALIVTPLHIIGFLLQILSPSPTVIQIGRFLNGVAGGLTSGVVPVYISEISTNKYRTAFGAGVSLFYLFGTIYVFILGSVCYWKSVVGFSLIFPALGILTMMTLPDSPVWLVTKDRNDEAQTSLKWLRGQHYTQIEEELRSIQSHYDEVQKENVPRQKSQGCCTAAAHKTVSIFKRPDVYKPLLIVMTLMVLQQFCGMSAITYYAIKILMDARTSIDKYAATVIFGIVRLSSQILGTFLLTRFARRKLLFTSALFMGLGTSLIGLGTYFKDAQTSSSFIGILPILGICISATAYPIGLSPIPWSYTSELFPIDLRAEMCGLTNALANSYIFCVVLSFPFISEALGGAFTFWLYSLVCLLVIAFTVFFLPETKGLKLEDISKSFSKSSKAKGDTSDDPAEAEGLV